MKPNEKPPTPRAPTKLEQALSGAANRAVSNILKGEFGTLGTLSGILETIVGGACDVGILKCGDCSATLVCVKDELACPTCKVSVKLPKFGESDLGPPVAVDLEAFLKKDIGFVDPKPKPEPEPPAGEKH